MILDRPLLTVTPTVDGDVLAVLARADAAFTAPGVQKLIGRHSVPGVRKALQRLAVQGIVDDDRAGRTVRYWLNREHLAADAIIELAGMSDALTERLRTAVSAWPLEPQLVMLFGSAARGDMGLDSDIDVFVVGDDDVIDDEAWGGQIGELERLVATWTGNDARVLAFRSSDLARGPDPVLMSIQQEGIHIIGDHSLLRAATEESA